MTVLLGMNSDRLHHQVHRQNLPHQLLQAVLTLLKLLRLRQSVEAPLLLRVQSLKILILALVVTTSHRPILGSEAQHQRHSAVYLHLQLDQCQAHHNPIVELPLQLVAVKKGLLSTLN